MQTSRSRARSPNQHTSSSGCGTILYQSFVRLDPWPGSGRFSESMSAILGGCGVPFHTSIFSRTLRLSRRPALCSDCSRSIGLGHGHYSCAQCGHKLCTTCASLLRFPIAYNSHPALHQSGYPLNPTNLSRARQQSTSPPVLHGRQSDQRRPVDVAQSSRASLLEKRLYELSDSDDDDEVFQQVSRGRQSGQRRTVDVAQSSRTSPLERRLYEVDVSDDSDDEDDDDQKQPVIACPGSISHELQFLKKAPYKRSPFKHRGSFGCDMCKKSGSTDLYHCETCQFDAHRACAEIEMQVKVFFHKHPLQLEDMDEEDITCRFCLGESEGDIRPWIYKCPNCPNFAVHARCAKYAKSLKHNAHPHQLNLVQSLAIGESPDFACDGCGDSIHQGYHYTCTGQSCDFDLHPLCAILPSLPLCPFDPTHRAAVRYQPLGSEECALCNSPANEAYWMYVCMVCDVFMHTKCLNADFNDEELSDDELGFSESDEEDEESDELNNLYQKVSDSMADFGNQDIEEQADKLSELADSFLSYNEPAPSLARRHSAKSRVHRQMSTPAQSEVHTLDDGFANMSLDGSSRPEVRSSDAEEEERKRAKQAAKEQRQKEKAAARALQEQGKAVRREEKARYMEELANQLQNLAVTVQNQRQSGNNGVAIAKELADIKAKIETGQALDAKRHQEQTQRHQEHMSGLHEIIRTQVHSTTRAVPRLVLITETTSKTRKLLTVLRLGLKGVQLHLLCEYAQQPHAVAGASGCMINQKVAGDRWTNLQPFLAAGVQVVAMAIQLAGMSTGVSALGAVLPDFHQKVWDTQAIDLGKHAIPTGRNTLARRGEEDALAEQAAAQWLISYLNDQNIDIADSFQLYRVRYRSPDDMKGAVGWLCQKHLDSGMKARVLERFPVC